MHVVIARDDQGGHGHGAQRSIGNGSQRESEVGKQRFDLTTGEALDDPAVRLDTWEDKNGGGKRSKVEIIANVVTSPHHLSATMVTGRIHRMTELFGRLAPGATLDQARAQGLSLRYLEDWFVQRTGQSISII